MTSRYICSRSESVHKLCSQNSQVPIRFYMACLCNFSFSVIIIIHCMSPDKHENVFKEGEGESILCCELAVQGVPLRHPLYPLLHVSCLKGVKQISLSRSRAARGDYFPFVTEVSLADLLACNGCYDCYHCFQGDCTWFSLLFPSPTCIQYVTPVPSLLSYIVLVM